MKPLAVIILVCLTTLTYAQNGLSTEYGKIGSTDFTYVPEDDPEAPAVILFDKGKTKFADFDGWYELDFTRTKRIKILSEEGLKNATFEIYLYEDGYEKTEFAEDIEGFTYNLIDGVKIERTPLDPKEIYEEKENKYWKKKVFTMPQVKVGSVIEVTYRVTSPFFFNLQDWEFQSSIPTVHSEYTVWMIPFYEYVTLLQGTRKLDKKESYVSKGISRYWSDVEFQDMINTWVKKDVPAFKDESYISSRNDYIMKIDFQLSKYYSPYGGEKEIMTTWPQLIEDLEDSDRFGKFIKKSTKVGSNILESELDITGLDQAQKAQAIIEYVKSTFKWDGFYGKYAIDNPKTLLKKKSGNIASINLFLIGLLRAADIDAKPVILSTRSHGKINTNYPFLSYFNYVITMVDTGTGSYLTDGTEHSLPYNRLPIRCMNNTGLAIGGEEPLWVDLYSEIESIDSKRLQLSFDLENQVVSSSVTNVLTEFDAYAQKKKFKNDGKSIQENLLKSGFSKVEGLDTRNYDSSMKPYIIAYKGANDMEIIDGKILVKPLLNFPISSNHFTQKTRTYPVDFIYKKKEEFFSTFDLPKNYRAVYIPESYTIDNQLVSIKYSVSVKGNNVSTQAEINLKKAVYTSGEYNRLKSYFGKIVKYFNDAIVLEKTDL
ncbi:MAG: DUF3857 domain-containing protein [Cyclobacteriaceae bacterium]